MCLPPYDPYRSPVVCMDMEVPPVRMMRDPFVMKSNYISYMTHASWQQETRAACERSRKYTIPLLGGLIETENADAEILIVASGTAVAQGREAIRLLDDEGMRVGLVKIKSLRPFPYQEIREATQNAKRIFVPEFNIIGWLAQEIKACIPNNERVIVGPHVAGGMTMPPEVIVERILKTLGALKGSILAGRGS
jgi:pyruvate ferredoxin oxidoreductase alpha subunit